MLKKIIKRLYKTTKDLYRPLKKQESKNDITWSKAFDSYASANSNRQGYADVSIAKKVEASALKVKNGEAVYERDSFLFDELQHNWPLVACVERAAIENGLILEVIDFGGSLGSTYRYLQKVLPKEIQIKWNIIEQKTFVDIGKEKFETGELRFYHSVKDCLASGVNCNLLLLSGVLQCIEDFEQQIAIFNSLGVPYILIDRASLTPSDHEFWVLQTVPSKIYDAAYPCYFFNEQKLVQRFSNYKVQYTFNSAYDPDKWVNGLKCNWKGMLLKSN